MKKVLLIAAVAGLGFVACKKDRTCTCTQTVSGGGVSTTGTAQVTTHKKIKKGQAIAACHDTESTSTSGGVTYTTSTACTLS